MRKLMTTQWLYTPFLLFFLLNPTFVMAQAPTFQVKGQVMDSLDNESIPYATIKITKSDDLKTIVKALASDDNGKFNFPIVKGDYILSVQYIGKDAFSKSISVGGEKTLDLGILKVNTSDNMLSEVTVTAQRPLVRVDLDKITYSLEEDPESKTNNVLEMLKKVPMITVDGEDNIELKGSKEFKIYMNGKPSSMITSNPKDILKSMPASSIKDIEVITDPGAKYDAEGVAGIINIITTKNSSMGGYTATVSSGANISKGGNSINGGLNLNMKYGKFGFMGNMNLYNYNNPENPSWSERESFRYIDKVTGLPTEPDDKYISRNGFSKNNGNGQYGSGELSYEIDTLNLVQVSFSRYGGSGKNKNRNYDIARNIGGATHYEFNTRGNNEYDYGSTTLGADYQRTFSVKDRLLTFSYRLDMGKNDSESESEYNAIVNWRDSLTHQYSDGRTTEHTAQIDFTTPFGKIHTLETGLKYIRRISKSTSDYFAWDYKDEDWTELTKNKDLSRFRHVQDIVAAYAGYSAKVQKWGFKAGVRYEGTWLDAEFPLKTDNNFKKDYSNFVPSGTVTYQLRQAQTLRLGYNMSIRRPGIWHLNPYVNTSDELYVRSGNPNLDAVKYHGLNLNYSFFNPKLNINTSVSYNFSDNDIQEISIKEGNVTYRRPENIGKTKNVYMSLYANWSPTTKLRINGNVGGSYSYIKTNDPQRKLSSEGFSPRAYGNVQYTFPWKVQGNVGGGYFGPWRGLESKSSDYYHYNFAVSKAFIKDRLNIRFYASNPFQKDRTRKNTNETLSYRQESWNTDPMRRFGVYVSFRFGELKERIKKAARGITNDDQMGGGGGNQGGGEGGGN